MVNRAVVILLALAVAVQMLILSRQQNAAPAAPTLKAVEAIDARRLTVSVEDAPRLGGKDARVAIVEFADFECPFCRRHANSVLPSLKREFVDSGVAAYYYLHLPLKLHPHAKDAAKAAECARNQGRFWEMHDLLFDGTEPALLTPDALRKVASSLMINIGAFDACMGRVAARIAENVAEATRLNIEATPAFVLGTVADGGAIRVSTRINGAQPLDVFAKAIGELVRSGSVNPLR